MTAYVGGERVAVSDRDLLGTGGEGSVYLWQGRALKLYHDPNAAKLALAKIRAFPARLPRAVVAPLEVAHDGRGNAVGFTMAIVRNATEAMRLGQRKWRAGRVKNADVVALFADLHATVRALHARGVVAGDLNDGNVLFADDLSQTWLIDADSMQFSPAPSRTSASSIRASTASIWPRRRASTKRATGTRSA